MAIPILGGLRGKTWPWKLEDLDHKGTVIEGHFAPENLTLNAGSTFGETTGLNRLNPVIQFLHGNGRQFSFDALIFARDTTKKIEEALEGILKLTERAPDLKRPPVCRFSVGHVEALNDLVVVSSVGGIRIAELRIDGSLRSFEARINLIRYVPFSVEEQPRTSAESPAPSTRYVKTLDNDMFEQVAQREYGDPLKGVIIKAENPGVGDTLEAGETLKILPADHPTVRARVAPSSIALGNGKTQRKDLFTARGETRYLYGV